MTDTLKTFGIELATVAGTIFLADKLVWREGWGESFSDAGKASIAAMGGVGLFQYVVKPLILDGQ